MDTKNLTELLRFIAKLGNAVDQALEDGKITIADVGLVFSPISAAKEAFNDVDLIPAEISDLSEEEAIALVETFKIELNLSADNLEEIVEEGLAVAFALVTYVNKIRSLKSN